MNATVTTMIPAHALTMWADEHDIFISLPVTAGAVPYITKYPKSEAGLSKALAVLIHRRKELAPRGTTKYLEQDMVKRVSNFTQTQRENARRVLRLRKVISE